MNRTLAAAAACLIGLAGACAAAAQTSPSLGVTLGFIRDKTAQQGQINYAATTHDSSDNTTWSNQFTVEATNVTSNEGQCQVGFHWHTTVDSKVAQDQDSSVPFKLVTSVEVNDMGADIARIEAKDGHTTWTSSVRPAVWVVFVRRSDGHTNTIDFVDHDLANRVAKAMNHAAQLCGGTTSEPF
jgi:hypothetical protein